MFGLFRKLRMSKVDTETGGEQTGAQVVTLSYFDGRLSKSMSATYATYRTIRAHPTIALTRAMVIAPVVAANWSIESDDEVSDDIVAEIRTQFFPLRESLIKVAMGFGRVDFGWQGFEKVFDTKRSRITLRKLKPLLHDITTILVDANTGAFNGFIQTPLTGDEKTLDRTYSLNIPFDEEGTNWYGYPLLENARLTYGKWADADAGATRYDKKIAGSHWIVKYPRGKETVNGVEKSNGLIAADILNTLESSGSIAIPHAVQKRIANLEKDNPAWEISLLTAQDKQHSFVDREKYLDALLVRSLLMPERAVLESEFGTKAEAVAHQNIALTNAQLSHQYITRMVNDHAVDQILALNWGDDMRGKVRLVASPIIDEQAAFFRELYLKLLQSPDALIRELDNLDLNAIKDVLGLPKVAQVDHDDAYPPLPGVDARGRMGTLIRELFEEQGRSGNGD